MFLVELEDGRVMSLDARAVLTCRSQIRAFLLSEDPEPANDDSTDPIDLTLTPEELLGKDLPS